MPDTQALIQDLIIRGKFWSYAQIIFPHSFHGEVHTTKLPSTSLNIDSPCLGLAPLCNTSGAHCEWVFTVISGEGSAQDRNCRPRTSGHGERVGETLRSRWNRVAGFRDLTESDFDSGRCWSARTRYHEVSEIETNLEKQRVERWQIRSLSNEALSIIDI
jgi:hypothetical protein